MKIRFNPKEYEYLWTDHDVNFIFTSCYLFKEFRKADIILIYNWKDRGIKFFLAKKDRKRFSDYGIEFYKEKFLEWKKGIIKNIKVGKELIKETKQEKNKIQSMGDKEIKNKILERANLFQALGGNYFYTEFFFLDKVEKIIKERLNKKILDNIKQMGKLKFLARKVLNEFYNYKKIFKPYIDEISKRTKRDDLEWLSYQEVFNVIEGKNVPISDRGITNWVLAKKTKWNIVKGENAVAIIKEFDNYFFNKDLNEIKGVIANKGIYQGIAKVLRTIFSDNVVKEIKKVRKGDILVANTTGPEVMAACERAGAIVTDEGGITSHAAIVSRELGVPCIIGTKIATKIFKDGDYIEVDANKGVVRKIKLKS